MNSKTILSALSDPLVLVGLAMVGVVGFAPTISKFVRTTTGIEATADTHDIYGANDTDLALIETSSGSNGISIEGGQIKGWNWDDANGASNTLAQDQTGSGTSTDLEPADQADDGPSFEQGSGARDLSSVDEVASDQKLPNQNLPNQNLPNQNLVEQELVGTPNQEPSGQDMAGQDMAGQNLAGQNSTAQEWTNQETADQMPVSADDPEYDQARSDLQMLSQEDPPVGAGDSNLLDSDPETDLASGAAIPRELDSAAEIDLGFSDLPLPDELDQQLASNDRDPSFSDGAMPETFEGLPFDSQPQEGPLQTDDPTGGQPGDLANDWQSQWPSPSDSAQPRPAQDPTESGNTFQPAEVQPIETGELWWQSHVQTQFWPTRQPQMANLDQVVFSALQNAPEVQVLNAQPQIEQTVVDQSLAKFDWSTFVSAAWSEVNEPIGSLLTTGLPSAGNRFIQRQLAFEAGAQRQLQSGGQFRVRQSLGILDSNSTFLDPQDQGSAQLVLDYRQPLMRGRGSQISQSQIVLARLNADAVGFESMERLQAYVQSVVAAYWTLYRERAVLVLRIRSTQRANELVGELQSRRENALVRMQLVRAQAAATQRKSDLIEQQFRTVTAQDRLLNLTHGPDVANPENVELIPTDFPPTLSIPTSIQGAVETAIQNRPEIKIALADIRTATVNSVLAENELLPQLDAVISSYVTGIRDSRDVGNAFVDQFRAGDPSYSVGMSFEVPIGRRVAKSKVHRAQLQTELLKNRLRKSLGDVALDARTMYRNSNRLSAEIQNNQDGLEAAAQELNYVLSRSQMLENQQNGSLYVENLLATQARLTQAERRFVDARVEHSIALVSLKRATGEFMQQQLSPAISSQQVDYQAPLDANGQTVIEQSYAAPIGGGY